ncbi:MAG: RNA methyltransferase [Clostridia bacterium]|nr:RNA methyltransferase [Clostridia bacterium]
MVITSTKNEQVRTLKKLELRKYREETGSFFIEGPHGVGEGIGNGARLLKLVVNVDAAADPECGELVRHAEAAGVPLIELTAPVFNYVCDTETPQGIGGVFELPEPFDAGRKDAECVLLLENLQNPGNMGTILRTADAAGFSGVICSKGCVDVFNPKTVRSTSGSLFRVPVLQSRDSGPVIAEELKRKGYKVTAAHPRGGVSYIGEDFAGKVCIVIGNEANGVSKEMLDCCDKLVTIPMPGGAESLNASVAAALMIYEAARKKGKLG